MPSLRQASTPDDIAVARTLFAEYAATLGIDLGYQDFATELATLPGDYAPPAGRLLLAHLNDEPAGCVGLRPFAPKVAELKRLYVRPRFRGYNLGELLVAAAIAEARHAGYERIRLDTLPSMAAAQRIYERLGFREIPPYNNHPIPGTRFLELRLDP